MLQLPKTAMVESHAIIAAVPAESFPSDIWSLIELHRKAVAASDAMETVGAKADAAAGYANEILDALMFAKAQTVRQESARLWHLSGYLKTILGDDTDLSGYFDLTDLIRLSKTLEDVTTPPHPTKRMPNFTKGKKLTRAGLLYRYHSFLISKLKTLSIALYGNEEFGCYFYPREDAVDDKLRRAGSGPFLNPRKLTARARTVLKSLKVDTENATCRDPRV